MECLRFKGFVWPRNPHTYKESFVREPQYYTEAGVDFYDHMGDMKRIITGSGVFFGEEAFEQFRELAELMDSDEPGDLVHPIWGERYCYLTGLELTQEPEDNRISYSFQFTEAFTNGGVPK